MNFVRPFPRVSVELREDTSGEVAIQGVRYAVPATGDATATRRAALELVAQRAAAPLRRPVRVAARDTEGTWLLLVHPNGIVTADSEPR